MKKISVIMPAYNTEKYIGQAIESILNQTYKNFEFIIINDGSIDKTKEIIQSYKDERIVYLENEKNLGIVVTLNKGLKYATGEYIARMDSDDISAKDRFEKQVTYLNKKQRVGLLGTGICIIDENMEKRKRIFSKDSNQLKAELIFNSCIAHPTAMMRKSVLEEHNLRYDEDFIGAEDYRLWWEIAKVSNIETLQDILLYYRIHSSQITKKKDKHYYDIMQKLMLIRLHDIGFSETGNETTMFLKYCLGEYKTYTVEEMRIFVNCLRDILKCNQNTRYFEQKELAKLFENAIFNLLKESMITINEKNAIYQFAKKNGMFTLMTRLKVKYYCNREKYK